MQKSLRAAADAVERHPDRAWELGVDPEEAAAWRDAARDMLVPYDEVLAVHPQAEQFTENAVWDFAHTSPDKYPLMLHFPYFDLYRKQADLMLALYLRVDAFSPEDKARNFEFYEPLTVRDSSLPSFVQAVVAADLLPPSAPHACRNVHPKYVQELLGPREHCDLTGHLLTRDARAG